MRKCIICGKTEGEKREYGETTHLEDYNLPHGKITICMNGSCRKHLTLQINDFAYPMVWVSKDDLYEEDFIETLTEEEAENLTADDMIEIAGDSTDYIFNCGFGDTFREALDSVTEQWRKEKERKLVESTPLKELPLLIEDLKYESNKTFLGMRLKEKK